MYEIAISPVSRIVVSSTVYDSAAGFQFPEREPAEEFCRKLNLYCLQPRFLVIPAGRVAETPAHGSSPKAA